MKYIHTPKAAIFGILLLFLVTSCSKEYETETFDSSSLVTVKIQGTQSAFNQVNIDVLEVQFRVLEDETDPNAWITLHTINTGIHDFTTITDNDVVTLVDFDEVPSDYIYSIKLVFGDQNSAVKNGLEYLLDMSPENENGCQNIVGKQLISNTLYEFVIELDLNNSIELSTDGNAKLDPKMNTVLRRFDLF